MRSLLFFLLVLLLIGCEKKQQQATKPLTVANTLGGEADSIDAGYARAIQPRQFKFPEDHASHPLFRNEWWYLTGNVSSAIGQQFGYQITFFRIALQPHSPALTKRESQWASDQVWMAHAALTDISGQQYYHAQRFARDALGLAGFQQQPFKVWLEDWQINAVAKGEFPWQVHFKHNDITLDLTLFSTKLPVLQGDKGLSQKSAAQGNASYYYSMTQLQTTGKISIADQVHQVTGKSWLDREWSTSALGKNQIGWDWFALQFDDDSELMYYQMRTKSGKADSYSAGKYTDATHKVKTISHREIQLTPLSIWTSPTGQRYPVRWRMHLPTMQKTWLVEAQLAQQEMTSVINYWEGAVRIVDEKTNKLVGKGYLEMTGY